MPKIIWSCSECGTVLPLWQTKCTNCHKRALSWLHVVAGMLVILPAVFILIKLL